MSLSLLLAFVLLFRPSCVPPPFLIIILSELLVQKQLAWPQESPLRLLMDFQFVAYSVQELGDPTFQSPRLWPCLLLNSS